MNPLEFPRKIHSKPTVTQDFSEYGQIVSIQLSPYDWSQDIILIAFENKILLCHMNFEDILRINILFEFQQPSRCTALTISPETSLSVLPNQVVFCAAGNDFKLRVYNSDLMENNVCKLISGHTSYVNDIKYDSENTYLASISDDNTVKVWSVEDYSCSCSFDLTSPGVSVVWNRTERSKLMVAEKIGIIRFYNVLSKIPLMSLDSGKSLSCADWSSGEKQLVASLQFGEILMWDIAVSSLPSRSSTIVSTENGGYIKFSHRGELMAVVHRLESALKIIDTNSQEVKLSASVGLPTNACWHYRYPIVCIGDDSKLCLWKIEV